MHKTFLKNISKGKGENILADFENEQQIELLLTKKTIAPHTIRPLGQNVQDYLYLASYQRPSNNSPSLDL